MRILLIVMLFGLMEAARSFAQDTALVTKAGGVTLAGGFLLLTAFLGGSLFADLRLPRLTGYLAVGLLVGPDVLGLVSTDMLSRLGLFNGIAISLIALTAGAEIDLREMRPLFRSIAWITLLGVAGAMAALSGAAFLLRGYLPFFDGLDFYQAGAVATVLGVMMAAQSPAVVVALRGELDAEGPVTRTVLGVVVISDLVVILMFTLVSTLAKRTLGVLDDGDTASHLVWEIVGSLVVGAIIGAVISFYLRYFRGRSGLTVVMVGFLVAEVGRRVQLDPLLIALGAGIFVRNLSVHGERLLAEINSASMPVYVVFFAVAGATVHVSALTSLMLPVACFVLIRAAALLAGSNVACRIAETPPEVRRYAGFGLLPQAGLALALALLFARTFPSLGEEAAALVFGIVAANELVAPVLYRFALIRSGEAGKRPPEATPQPSSSGTQPALPRHAHQPGS